MKKTLAHTSRMDVLVPNVIVFETLGRTQQCFWEEDLLHVVAFCIWLSHYLAAEQWVGFDPCIDCDFVLERTMNEMQHFL